MKKQILMMMAVVFLGGCAAGPAPVWQSKIYNLPPSQHAAHILAGDDVSQPNYKKRFYWSISDLPKNNPIGGQCINCL